MATRGIDIVQSTDRIVFRASLKDADGAKVTSGTTELRVYRLEDDGTLDVYDWTTDDFVAPGAGTPDDETTMTHRQRRDSTGADVDTGLWSVVLSTLTNWTVGQIYIAQVTNSGATPESQEQQFQFGGAGDDVTNRLNVPSKCIGLGTVESTGTTATNIKIKTLNFTPGTNTLVGQWVCFPIDTPTAGLEEHKAQIVSNTATDIVVVTMPATPAEDEEFTVQ